MRYRFRLILILLPVVISSLTVCDTSDKKQTPNILFVVWDTVRADHLGVYGYDRPTTPHLDEWARTARVYDNCISAASTTVPSHASMFTGLLPIEHGTSNEQPVLSEELTTLAELLNEAGYGTYMFSANPFISSTKDNPSFSQGFEVVEHPWSPQYFRDAIQITRSKVHPKDRTSLLADKILRRQKLDRWNVISCGELALRGVEDWLSKRDSDQPFFIFLNYMEAHAPLLPSVENRSKMIKPELLEASYKVNRRFAPVRLYTFGLHEYTEEEIALTEATYDAVLCGLDEMFHSLLQSLEVRGFLTNTVIVLVSDHGEHLGEHHLLDHQFSVYEPLMRVPLLVHYPELFAPGRDERPVSTLDLFPTLLELAGVENGNNTKAISLLHAQEERTRVGECPDPMFNALRMAQSVNPSFDAAHWDRALMAYYQEPYKLLRSSNEQHELYNLVDDPDETKNLIHSNPETVQKLFTGLSEYLESLKPTPSKKVHGVEHLDADQQEMLRNLGYIEEEKE